MKDKLFEFIRKQKRTETDKAVNAGLFFEVGGCSGKETLKTIELRAPNLTRLGKHTSMFAAGIMELLKENGDLFQRLTSDPKSVNGKELFNFDLIAVAGVEIIADLVGESNEWVKEEMTGQQTVGLMSAYLDLIGWDFIVQSFTHAWQSWNAALKAATKKK